MRIRRLCSNVCGAMALVCGARSRLLSIWLPACCLVTVGCSHHRADQYAYAPPYAPPVYPQPQQPQVQMPAQPSPYATAGVPAVALPAGSLPPGDVVAGAPMTTDGTVIQAVGGECPPCSADGMVVGGAAMPVTMIDGSGQTPPCPPGP